MRRLNKLFGRDDNQDYGEYDESNYPDEYYQDEEIYGRRIMG